MPPIGTLHVPERLLVVASDDCARAVDAGLEAMQCVNESVVSPRETRCMHSALELAARQALVFRHDAHQLASVMLNLASYSGTLCLVPILSCTWILCGVIALGDEVTL